MANPSPAFQFYPRDFLSDPAVMMMNNAELGAYVRLLCHAWDPPPREDGTPVPVGHLPFEEDLLSALANVTKKCWRKTAGKIGRAMKYDVNTNTTYSKRLVAEWEKQQKHRDSASEAGKKSAAARSRTVNGKPTAVAAALVSQPTDFNSSSSSASSDFITDPDLSPPARARVMAGFQARGILMPDAEQIRMVLECVDGYARASGRDPCQVADEALAAFDRLKGTWHVDRFSSLLFRKHWEEIQRVMGGSQPESRRADTRGQLPVPDLDFTGDAKK